MLLSGAFSAVEACEQGQAIAPTPAPETIAVEPAQADTGMADLEQEVLAQINAHRQSIGLEPLASNPVIVAQSREHSQQMAAVGSLSHDGFEERVEAIAAALSYRSAGENVASNQGFADPATQAVQGWLNSPGHRRNIEGDFDLTGIGIAQAADGTYYLTQIFIKTR
jgi:uncharacterized protein YkwD